MLTTISRFLMETNAEYIRSIIKVYFNDQITKTIFYDIFNSIYFLTIIDNGI